MNSKRAFQFMIGVLIAVPGASADMTSASRRPVERMADPVARIADHASAQSQAWTDYSEGAFRPSALLVNEQPLSSSALNESPFGPIAPDSTQQIRQLPATPGSVGLFLSAALSAGAWQLVRSARHFQFGAVPEWYHTGGPLQVGHYVPMEWWSRTLPALFGACVEPDGAVTLINPGRLLILRPRAQCVPVIRSPRAPPTF